MPPDAPDACLMQTNEFSKRCVGEFMLSQIFFQLVHYFYLTGLTMKCVWGMCCIP